MSKTAVVFGATGLVGGHLLQQLLNDPAYRRVIAVSRRRITVENAKLQHVIASFDTLETVKDQLVADCFFCCLGTTRRQVPNREAYYAVDHDYPVAVSKIAKAVGAKTFILVSAVGANPKSANFYIRMKGAAEHDVSACGVERIGVFRPSLLTGHRQTFRFLERFSAILMTVINPFLIGQFSRFRSIPAKQVARAMVALSHHTKPGVTIYHWKEIKKWQ